MEWPGRGEETRSTGRRRRSMRPTNRLTTPSPLSAGYPRRDARVPDSLGEVHCEKPERCCASRFPPVRRFLAGPRGAECWVDIDWSILIIAIGRCQDGSMLMGAIKRPALRPTNILTAIIERVPT